MDAKYDGHCVGCGRSISPGQEIEFDGDRWVHAGCIGILQIPDKPPPICPDCHLQIPCWCG